MGTTQEIAASPVHRLHRMSDFHQAPCLSDLAEFDRLWADMLDGAEETGAKLEVLGRKMHFPRAAGGLLRASFASLCQQALGPQDYLAIAERFHTLFLEDVPVLDKIIHNQRIWNPFESHHLDSIAYR